MDLDPVRLTAAASALAGGVFWGLFSFATTLLGGQPVAGADVARAVANVVIGIAGGGLVAYFLAPALAPLIPFVSLRDPHAVGFGLGAGAWEAAPFVYGWLKARGAKAEGAAR